MVLAIPPVTGRQCSMTCSTSPSLTSTDGGGGNCGRRSVPNTSMICLTLSQRPDRCIALFIHSFNAATATLAHWLTQRFMTAIQAFLVNNDIIDGGSID